jgi:hypothetical protein
MLAVEPGVGRPPELDEATSHKLWHALSARLTSDADRHLHPEEYLVVQEETSASLRAIWTAAQHWLEAGDVNAYGSQTSKSFDSRPSSSNEPTRMAQG